MRRKLSAALCAAGAGVMLAASAHAGLTFETIAISGQQAAGFAPTVTYKQFGSTYLTINNAGQVAFPAVLQSSDGSITTNNDAVNYVGLPASPTLVTQESSAGPEGIGSINIMNIQGMGEGGHIVMTGTYDSGTPFGLASTTASASLGGDPVNGDYHYARKGDPAPGGIATTLDSVTISAPRVADNGTAILRSQMTTNAAAGVTPYSSSTGTPNTRDLIMAATPNATNSGGNLSIIARTNSPTPAIDGVPDAIFPSNSSSSPWSGNISISGPGKLVFRSTIAGTGVTTSTDDVIFAGPVGAVAAVIREGGALDGLTIASFSGSTTEQIGINDAGAIVFAGALKTGTKLQDGTTSVSTANDSVVLVEKNGKLRIAMIEGQTVPDTGGGVLGGTLPFGSTVPAIGGAGHVVAGTSLKTDAGLGITSSNDGLLLLSDPWSNLTLIAREGAVAPGTDSNTIFTSISNSAAAAVNAHGQVAYKATLKLASGTIDTAVDTALYLYSPLYGMQLVAREGDTWPTPFGDKVINAISAPGASGGQDGRLSQLNDNGELFFQLNFTDGTQGLFLATVPEPASLSLLALAALPLLGRRRR